MRGKRSKRAAPPTSPEPSASTASPDLPTLCAVDTNVPIVANAREAKASPDCVLECVRMLRRFDRDECRLLLDNAYHIVNEYKHLLNQSGQPGPGDAFLRWALTNMHSRRCELVSITPSGDSGDKGFVEFPDDPKLNNFDLSDRKFVAVIRAHPEQPPLLNATDSDWLQAREALEANGVRVVFLCPQELKVES